MNKPVNIWDRREVRKSLQLPRRSWIRCCRSHRHTFYFYV